MPFAFIKRKCLWLAIDSDGQLRLYVNPESEDYLCVPANMIAGLDRLPREGEYLPIWLKISSSAYSQSVIPRARIAPMYANCAEAQIARRGAAAHNACAYTETASPCEETTKRETTKEGSTKKEDKKKRRKEDGLPSVGQTDTTETRVSAKNALRDGEKVRSPRRSSTPPSPPAGAVVQPVRTPAGAVVQPVRTAAEAAAAKRRFWDECAAYIPRYGQDYVTAFFGYWAETDACGGMRWERQRFFNIANRLARWNPDRGGELRRAIAADVRRRARAASAEADATRQAIAADEEQRLQAARAARDAAARHAVTPEEARATPEYWAALGAHRDAAGGATGSGEGRT